MVATPAPSVKAVDIKTGLFTKIWYNLLTLLKSIRFSGTSKEVIILGPYDTDLQGNPVKVSSLTVLDANAGSHSGTEHFASFVESVPHGSGVNGPTNADVGFGVSLFKENWTDPSLAGIGEIDGAQIYVRQGGPLGGQSDISGLLISAQNCGPIGGLSMWEGSASTISSTNFAILQSIYCAAGVMATHSGVSDGVQGFGLIIAAQTGASGHGLFVHEIGGTFTNAITVGGTPTFTVAMDGTAHVHKNTAIPAGGSVGKGLKFSSSNNFGVFFGSGPPTLTAVAGSLYLRTDGTTTNDRAYINTGTTSWTALITAA